MPADAKVHDRPELPEPVTLVDTRVQLVLLLARLTTPANPFRPVTVIVDAAVVPALAVRLVELATIMKSRTTKVTVAEWDREPLVPTTVNV